MKALLRLVTVLALLPGSALAAPLDEREERLVASVTSNLEEGLALLETAVNINSGTMNFAGVKEVGELFRGPFQDLGFTVEWKPGAEWGRAGHLVAERPGMEGGHHILFIGHLDTVFEPDSPFQRFEKVDAFHATGPGSIDMKGGIVVMLLALEALREIDALDAFTFTVVLTGDEEKPGTPLELARADLIEAADKADIAIGFEDGDGNPATAVVARRGFTSWNLTTGGERAHSSQIFREDLGSGAIYEAARILSAFHDTLQEEYLTFNPGVILGGTTAEFDEEQSGGPAFGKTNVIAQTAVVNGDLRAVSLEQRERAKEAMRRIVAEHLPRTTARIEFTDGYPPLAPTKGNHELLSMFSAASEDLGYGVVEPVNPSRAGAADVSFTAGRVGMAMDGVGLMGDGGHTPNEIADLRTLPMQAQRMAIMLYRMASQPR